MVDLDSMARDVEAAVYRRGGVMKRPMQIRFRCPMPQRHKNGDLHPSADYNPLAHVWRCTVCEAGGGLVGGNDPLAPLLGIGGGHMVTTDPAQLAVWAAERDAAAASLEADKARKADALREYWAARRDVMAGEARVAVLDALLADGIGQHAVDHFRFRADTYSGTAAVVIPWTVRGEIRAVQYRLLGDVTGGRYRWHAGSRPTIFNADAVLVPDSDTIIVVEGAKKCAALWTVHVESVCAVVNKGGWKPEYAAPFAAFDRVVFALDPDAWQQSVDAARTIPGARAVRLPMKPDDLLLATGGDVDVLWRYIRQAKAVDA